MSKMSINKDTSFITPHSLLVICLLNAGIDCTELNKSSRLENSLT